MPQLLLDAFHSVQVVVQVGVHVIDNDHRHDGLVAHALKEKLPKARTITLRAAGPATEGVARGKGIPPCPGFDTKTWSHKLSSDHGANEVPYSRSRRCKVATLLRCASPR